MTQVMGDANTCASIAVVLPRGLLGKAGLKLLHLSHACRSNHRAFPEWAKSHLSRFQ